MNRPDPTTASTDDRVARILDEYLAAQRAGNAPTKEALLARHPDLAAELADCLASLSFLQQGRLTQPGESPVVESREGQVSGTLGDFRILRVVGRGGMGTVYEAMQTSLDRRVALKVLPFAATLDPKHLRRFQNEAHAAAHLHHQHIVPVYGVGVERGVHYYAMQFIDGRTVADMIDELRQQAALQPRAGKDLTGAYHPASGTSPAAARSTERSYRTLAYFQTVARLGL